MKPHPTLQSIIAYARSGAIDYAWRLLCDAGIDRINDNPDILNVLGRLLKDRALNLRGDSRRHLFLEAANAYMRASEIHMATYPLINAATLSMLAGQSEQAQTLAHQVLLLLQSDAGDRETPYYRAATEAEALLLLGNIPGAKSALKKAMAKTPDAFADHASTLRQLSLILTELDADKSWLEPYRPPRSLHYAGHLAVAPDDACLAQEIRRIINTEHIGYGFGALAAGADICIAEALLEAGAELHLVLPLPPDAFRKASVARYGMIWAKRYDQVLLSADSIKTVGDTSEQLSVLSLQLAAEVAMGCAVMQANTLMTDAVQLLILDQKAAVKTVSGSSAWISSVWDKKARHQHIIVSPRTCVSDAGSSTVPSTQRSSLTAMLRIARPGTDPLPLPADIVCRIRDAWAKGPSPLFPPRWGGDTVTAAFSTPAHAAEAALAGLKAVADEADICIAGHYGIVELADDPFGSGTVLLGPAAAWPGHIAHTAPPGTIYLTENFAAALHIAPAQTHPRTEFVGEVSNAGSQSTTRLFTLTHPSAYA